MYLYFFLTVNVSIYEIEDYFLADYFFPSVLDPTMKLYVCMCYHCGIRQKVNLSAEEMEHKNVFNNEQ